MRIRFTIRDIRMLPLANFRSMNHGEEPVVRFGNSMLPQGWVALAEWKDGAWEWNDAYLQEISAAVVPGTFSPPVAGAVVPGTKPQRPDPFFQPLPEEAPAKGG